MSRIDDLIRDLCPDGVTYQLLVDITTRVTDGSHNPPKASDGGTYPMISAKNISNDRIDFIDARMLSLEDYEAENRRTAVEVGDVLLTIVGAIGRSAVVKTEAPMVFQRSVAVIKPKRTRITSRFLHYVIGSARVQRYMDSQANGAAQKGLYLKQVEKLRIPVPPLEVQREIVRVLDKFTQLEAELEAELEARRAQYQHYLRSVVLPDGDIAWTTLGEAAHNHDRRRRPVTRADRQGGAYPYYGANGVQDYVHDYIFDGTFLLVGEDGSVKNADGTPILNWAAGKIWVNNHAHVLTAAGEHFNLRYLYYYLATVDVAIYVTGGTQPKINQKNLNRIPVPLVSRSYQDEVVGVLDKFDALVNDISIGLPAELAARRKQYEHYRDRLLTFKELAS